MAAWEEGKKVVDKAKLFAGGAFVVLLLLAIYAGAKGNTFDAAYFAFFSLLSLFLYFYVKKVFKVREY